MAEELPPTNVYITSVSDPKAKTSTFLPPPPTYLQPLGPGSALHYIYSTVPSFTLEDDQDLKHYQITTTSGPPYVAFPAAGATNITYLTFSPNPEQEEGFWHRTQTIDYIIMLEGELELSVDGEERRVMKMGDVAVQRAVMHKWKNVSKTNPARYVCVMLGVAGAKEGDVDFRGLSLE